MPRPDPRRKRTSTQPYYTLDRWVLPLLGIFWEGPVGDIGPELQAFEPSAERPWALLLPPPGEPPVLVERALRRLRWARDHDVPMDSAVLVIDFARVLSWMRAQEEARS